MSQIQANPGDIAVIGMSGRFPGAPDIARLWRNLCDEVEAVSFLSEEQLRAAGIDEDLLADADYVRAAYQLQDADRFDAAFFGYAPREARFIDPQQRVFLECAQQALEDAAYAGGAMRNIGVYAGASLNTYLLFTGLAEQFKRDPVLTLMSNDKDFLATRVSYKLGLEGPSMTVQTACSTSLTALHMACQALLAFECDIALSGGVCVKVPLDAGYLYREGGMLSRDGHCRPFDADASGTIFGSGAGVVVLKRYAEALADGDTVHAVIKGTAINNDGARKASYTAPSVRGIADAITQALDFAAIDAAQISYVECHGTGTPLGDPIEVHALTAAFQAAPGTKSCHLGSVKSNIGHLESASGIASFIKTVCCLKHQYLPATLHYKSPNPALGLAQSPFEICARGQTWRSTQGPRTALINSLGVGGTNASVVVQEAAAPQASAASARDWHLLPISARNLAQLKQFAAQMQDFLHQQPDINLADAAHTLQWGRQHHEWREMLLCHAPSGQIVTAASLSGATLAKTRAKPLVCVLEHELSLSLHQALLQEASYRQHWQQLEDCLPQMDQADSGAAWSQVASVRAQIALYRHWRDWGVQVHTLLGAGAGAYAAAFLAGAISSDILRATLAGGRIDAAAVYAATLRQVQGQGQDDVQQPQGVLPVREAAQACRDLLDALPAALLLPFGPHGALFQTIGAMLGDAAAYSVIVPLHDASLQPPALLQQAAALWMNAAPFSYAALYHGEKRRRIPLPVTPLMGERFWWGK